MALYGTALHNHGDVPARTSAWDFTRGRPASLAALCLSLAMALALATAASVAVGDHLAGVDDANIYMTYGRNVAAGRGFVYGIGGERVEGFTSLAWALLVAAAYVAAPASPERLLFAVSIALVALTGLSLIRFLGTTGCRPASLRPLGLGLLLVAWCLSSPPYGVWMTTSLMETSLWSLTLCGGTVAFARLSGSDRPTNRWLAAVVAGAAVPVRPEALAIVPMWIAMTFLVALGVHREIGRALRAVAPAAALFAIVVAGLTGFRLAYFGYPLPNTYYAKLSPDRVHNFIEGLRYLRDFVVSFPMTLAVFFASAALIASFALQIFARRNPFSPDTSGLRRAAPWAVIAASVLGISGLPLLTGGDHFAGFRVLQPVWPLFALPLVYFVSQHRSASSGAVIGAAVVGASYVLAGPTWIGNLEPLRHEYRVATGSRELGRLLNEVTAAGVKPSIGVIAVGGVATTYRGPIVDLMGLNNVRMGHSPGSRIGPKNHAAFSIPVFWELQPDFVIPRILAAESDLRDTDRWLADKSRTYLRGLTTTAPFRERYRLIVLRRPGADDYPSVLAYCRADWLADHASALQWDHYAAVLQRAMAGR